MGLFLLSALIVYLSSPSQHLLCAGTDRLAAGESISVNQTIVSAGEVFALGFFTPGNSTANRYAGIWYHRDPARTVVWVANRETPLEDPAGALTVAGDGNIVVLNGTGGILWSTSLSGVPSNTCAVLLDSGNLVLGRGEGGDLWQSFDHPTDTVLPGMPLRINLNTGVASRVTSWRDASDPAPGEYVLTSPDNSPLQFSIMKGSEIRWRSMPWSGSPQIAITLGPNVSSVYVETVQADDQGFVWTFTISHVSLLARYVLDQTGRRGFFVWDGRMPNWILGDFAPSTRPCDVYNRCGPSGSCDGTGNSPLSLCKCLDGFEPRDPGDWEIGKFTGGCVRRVPLRCDGSDVFVKFGGMKLPNGYSFLRDKSEAQCRAACSGSCGCTAYAYTNLGSPRCFIWLGELMDLGQITLLGDVFQVRFASPVPGNNTEMDDGSSTSKNRGLVKIILPILSIGMLLLGVCCYFFIRRLKSQEGWRKNIKLPSFKSSNSNELGSEKDNPDVPLLDFKSVKAATSDFSSANKLGEGGFGPVYKGKLSSGDEIAVKRLSKRSKQGHQEFANEVRLIAKLQHKNLVRLLGWCTGKDEKILIYEYMPNKSLDKFIFDTARSTELNWEKRFRIIEGIANGLLYLHQYSRMRVIHRDLKTSNILLDSEMSPKISDFGLARIFEMNQTEANTGHVVGTYGYMSPEYALDGVFSDKSDVFSFGVIILEIVSGKRSTGFYPQRNYLNLLGHAWQMWEEGRAMELRDPLMGDSFRDTEVLKSIQLGLLCIQEHAADRPPMSSVVSLLSNETHTLPLPKQPGFSIGQNIILPDGRISINELTESSIHGR